jgi:YHYH protein
VRTTVCIGGLLAAVALAVAACGDDGGSTASAKADKLDLTKLPLGDGKNTTSGPKRGYVYACQTPNGPPGATGSTPWIHDSTWDSTSKPTVDGSVDWENATYRVKRSGSDRLITGNGLPSHTTGVFPIQQSDDAYQYDRNPNSISAQTLDVEIPAKPKKASKPSCTSGGAIGVMDSGAVFFNALDAGGQDAAAHEIQDSCGGHPQMQGSYHYHALPACLKIGSKTAHSKRIGWAFDGFPIYGPRGDGGDYLRNSALDACHGHTHTIKVDGTRQRLYHYHATMEYPYTLGCFRGTAALPSP